MSPKKTQGPAAGPRSATSRKRALAIGLAAIVAAAIAGLVFLYTGKPAPSPTSAAVPPSAPIKADYLGSDACAGCHKVEFSAWQASQHAKAMQHADAKTVLGDFNNASFTYNGIVSEFFRKGDAYFVRTDGPDGKLAEFEIKYTFGLDPIQQYLVEFPDGRLQALSISWDSRPAGMGGQRWFHLYAGENVDASDELHWTRRAQNWNYMCSDCHSTDVRKNYDEATDTFNTSWKEISVGCEACHGPGSAHVQAAKAGGAHDPGKLTAHFIERNGVSWIMDAATGNARRSEPRTGDAEIQVCAQCHARRGQVADGYRPGDAFHDYYRASALAPGLYHADGQQRDEVYIWGSFAQSKMNQAGVTCSDCHDPHTQKLRAEGNAVCAGCHMPAKYDSESHHRHPQGSTGAQCANCHMPETTYMQIDPRRDHSLRVPRPDLSIGSDTPNACNGCHRESDAAWAADAIKAWGRQPKGHQQFAAAFASAADGKADANARLANIAAGLEHPGIARAGALELLAGYPTPMSAFAAEKALSDADPLVRRAAVSALQNLPPERRLPLLAPLLNDPVRTVRMEAASALADGMQGADAEQQRAFVKAAGEFEAAQRFNADTPEARSALGSFYARQGRLAEGEARLQSALKLEPRFVPAYVNLADLYRVMGRDADSERTLRAGLAQAPQSAELHHALGLALVRLKRMPEALAELQRAALLAPENPRYAYVLAVALNSTGKATAALKELRRGLEQNPGNLDLLIAGASIGRDSGDSKAIREFVQQLINRYPNDPNVRQFLQEFGQDP
ncbi:MAG: ammonia-forming cytochrome c nitrite reductase subunit c552 [Arenimonas sp.]|nr:ammonia-forming cytochrome c nitrite reductase subunit c552 [Arenimonas sp.]